MPRKYTDQNLLDELSRVTDFLGKPPSYDEMKRHGRISPKPYQTRYGTWEQVKRLTGWIPHWETFNPETIAPNDGHWFAGIIDGEGCFTMRRPVKKHTAYDPLFTISLRDDDSFMLDEIIRILGLENVHIHRDKRISERKRGANANPANKLTVFDIPTLRYHLITTLELYPLRSKKKNELIVFKMAAAVLWNKRLSNRLNCRYIQDEVDMLDLCYKYLKALKVYNADHESILSKARYAYHIYGVWYKNFFQEAQ